MKSVLPFSVLMLALHCSAYADALPCEPVDKNKSASLGISMPIFKCFTYSDTKGEFVLYLAEKQDRPYKDETLSSSIEAHLFKKKENGALNGQLFLQDLAGEDEAGLNYRSKLIEFSDLDGDGEVEPIIVYRFFLQDDDGNPNVGEYSGRIKIVMFYKGSKVVIRARTGELDHERKTTASPSFFTLPTKVQKHLVLKMKGMYNNHTFGFDNSFNIFPDKK
jgi:hypothetical protein